MKICKDCKHFRVKDDLRPGAEKIWYNQHCVAVERERGIDPQWGEPCFIATNSLGEKYFTNRQYPYAREINPDGECILYEGK